MDNDIFETITHRRDLHPVRELNGNIVNMQPTGYITSEYVVNTKLCRVLPFEYVYRTIMDALNASECRVTVQIPQVHTITMIMSIGTNHYIGNVNAGSPSVATDIQDMYHFIKTAIEHIP